MFDTVPAEIQGNLYTLQGNLYKETSKTQLVSGQVDKNTAHCQNPAGERGNKYNKETRNIARTQLDR